MEPPDRSLLKSDTGHKHTTTCHVNLSYESNPEDIESVTVSTPQGIEEFLDAEDEITLSPINGNGSLMNGHHKMEKASNYNDDIQMCSLPTSVPNKKQQSQPAVIVRNACKKFGNGPPILNNFGMTVQKGTIYSLLGSSGCGKTTLLSCVVGIRNLNQGEIFVFGGKPGTKESGIPGKRVGYMPQDTALYNDFSIEEAIRYFGTIYGMPLSEITTSRDFLIEFLDLPKPSRRIGSLSGGQKRRVSLAMSLIHSPELLILDEPTVGVDPLLRESIWNHLCKLVSSQRTTVIITTHYIEEARQSHTIGLMRGGRLLAEKSPEALLKEHNVTLLEDIVLKLCRKDRVGNADPNNAGTQDWPASTDVDINNADSNYRIAVQSDNTFVDDTNWWNCFSRLNALVRKNVVVMSRNILLLLFMIFVPSFQILLVCLAIGNDPENMHMGIVNRELNYSQVCLEQRITHTGCDVENLSCHYLSKLPQNAIILNEYDNEVDAEKAVRDGRIWGFMTFQEGYSDHVYSRASSGNIIDDEALNGSRVIFRMDNSNKQIALTIKRIFYDAYEDFVEELLINCGFQPEIGESPVQFQDPIYGSDDTDFREYIAPSLLLGVLFFFPLCSSGISYIWDKKQGTLERAMIAGVQTWEIMTAFFVTEGCVLVIQTGLSFFIINVIFDISVKGSLFLVLSLCFIVGLGGVSMGFLIASFCNEEIEAILLAMASFFPNFLIGGMMWPLLGMPKVIQYIAYLLPCTLGSEAVRSVISRGWGFTHPNVYMGFVSTISWICVYWIATITIHRVTARRK